MFGGQLDTFLIAFRLSPSAAANSGRTARLVCTLLFFSSLAKKIDLLCMDFYFMQALEWYVIIRTEHGMIITPSVTADNL